MPIYEGDQYTYEQLSDLRKRNVCAECGGRLDLYQNWEDTRAFIACADWVRTHHEGITRERSRYEKEGMASLNIKTRREIMEQEYGKEKTTALDKSRIPTTGALTQPQAMRVLKLVYPKVPEEEIVRCAILCRDFGLHPLMKEVYIIPFNEGKPNETWVTVLGITATRKIMSRQGTYSYLDNTPRVMTEKEQVAIFGEADGENIVAITKLRTRVGEEAQGYGRWPKNKQPLGTDKGNTKSNMAFIRSERNAFGRLFTDALPQGIEVIDEAYVEVPDVGKVIVATGEIIEDEVKEEVAKLKDGLDYQATHMDHWCQEHNCPFQRKRKFDKDFWSHSIKDANGKPILDAKGKAAWCNEGKETLPKAEPHIPESAGDIPPDESGPESEEPATYTIEALKETMQLCNWGTMEIGKFCNAEKGWKIQEFKDLTPEQIAEAIDYIKRNPK